MTEASWHQNSRCLYLQASSFEASTFKTGRNDGICRQPKRILQLLSTSSTVTTITLYGSAISSSSENPGPGAPMQMVRHAAGSHIAPTPTTSKTCHSHPPVRKSQNNQRRSPIIRQKVGGRGRRDEQMMMVDIVCFEQDNLALPVLALVHRYCTSYVIFFFSRY